MLNYIKFATIILGSIFLCSCESMSAGQEAAGNHLDYLPPAENSSGKKYDYFYYPTEQVYYCRSRRLYFWMDENAWKLGKSLPEKISLDPNGFIGVNINEGTPYYHYVSAGKRMRLIQPEVEIAQPVQLKGKEGEGKPVQKKRVEMVQPGQTEQVEKPKPKEKKRKRYVFRD